MTDEDWRTLLNTCTAWCDLERRLNLSAELGTCDLARRKFHHDGFLQSFHKGTGEVNAVLDLNNKTLVGSISLRYLLAFIYI